MATFDTHTVIAFATGRALTNIDSNKMMALAEYMAGHSIGSITGLSLYSLRYQSYFMDKFPWLRDLMDRLDQTSEDQWGDILQEIIDQYGDQLEVGDPIAIQSLPTQ